MNCSSSRSGTKVSCLRSSRRKMLLSFSTTPRAESGSKRISAETVFRVLNRKCGLIWLESASIRAFNSSCWCRSRFISTRVLFQIFSGAATDIRVAITTSTSHQSNLSSVANSHLGLVASTSATRPSSRPTHAPNGAISHDNSAFRNRRIVALGMLRNVNGPKFQRSSLLGIACRIKPPSSPAVDAAGMASHSCEISAGIVMIAPPIGPTTRPPSSPIRKAPSSDKSANAYGGPPTSRSVTPTISAGVMNSISLSFWSGSRSSVKSTRRKVFHRASNAAMDDAIPTLSSRVNSRSRTDVAVSIFGRGSQAKASQSAARCKAGIIGCGPRIKWRAWNQPLATRAEIGAKLSPCYTSRFPMRAKSQRGKKLNRKVSGLQMVAHAALPTRYGRFTIYGFRGRGPQEEAVALVRGKLNGKTAPLVRVHSQCLTGDVLASLRCDCRAQLELSLKKIGQAPSGILLYLPQEGRGIGLMNKLRAYELQDNGMDTVEANETLGFAADARDYDFSAQILKKLGAIRIRLLSNNPEKVRQLEKSGIRVVERVPCQPRVSKTSRAYLKTKKRKMGHLLEGI